MNRFIIVITLAIVLFTPPLVYSQTNEASPSSEAEISTIKENVKKRIESVVKGQQNTSSQKAAFIGKLVSVANDTLTIKTRDGIKLASSSESTTYVNASTSKSIKLEDIGIDDYISILGYLNEEGVLDARRIILSSEPETPTVNTFFGYINNIDIDEEIISLTSPQDSDLIDFSINKNSILEYQNQSSKSIIDLDDLGADTPALIIYKPSTSNKNHIIVHLLVNRIAEPLPTTSPTPSAKDDLSEIIPEELQ